MKENYLNSFITAAKEVIKELSDIEFKKEKVTLRNHPKPSYEIIIILLLEGFIKGNVIYSLPDKTAKKIIALWLEKDSISSERIEELFESCLGEMGSMITGKSMGKFNEQQKYLYIKPPQIINNNKAHKNIQFDFSKNKSIIIELNSDIGNIEITLSLTEA